MPMPALFDTAVAALYSALATPSGIVALCSAGVAGLLIIVSSFVKTMIPLRCLAIGGNLGFLIYGALHPSLILVLLHGALLPINVFRAAQMVRLTRRVQIAAASNDLSGVWLRPYMRRRRLRKDAILFRKVIPQSACISSRKADRVRRDRADHGARPAVRRDRVLRARQAPHADRPLRHPLHRAADGRDDFQVALFPEPRLRVRGGDAGGRAPSGGPAAPRGSAGDRLAPALSVRRPEANNLLQMEG